MKLKFDITAQEYTIVKAVLEQTLGSSCDVWVYGSRAKNRADFNSDLDLAVDCQDKIPAKILAGLHARFNEAKLAFTVDVVDLNDVEPRFRQIITQQKVPFPLSGMAPKLRFPGFGGEWEEKRLGDFCQINPKTTILPNEFIYIDLESVESGSLIKEETVLKANAPSRAQRLLSKRDVLFQMVRPYQKNNYYFDKDENYVSSTGYAQLRSNGSAMFLYQLINTNSFVNKVMSRCTGTSYPAINSSDLGKIRITIPVIPKERQKIAGFLTSVDTRIEQLGRKKTLWEQYKKGMMQKLFSREVRFRDAYGNDFPDWEETRLDDLAIVIMGTSPKSKSYNKVLLPISCRKKPV